MSLKPRDQKDRKIAVPVKDWASEANRSRVVTRGELISFIGVYDKQVMRIIDEVVEERIKVRSWRYRLARWVVGLPKQVPVPEHTPVADTPAEDPVVVDLAARKAES